MKMPPKAMKVIARALPPFAIPELTRLVTSRADLMMIGSPVECGPDIALLP